MTEVRALSETEREKMLDGPFSFPFEVFELDAAVPAAAFFHEGDAIKWADGRGNVRAPCKSCDGSFKNHCKVCEGTGFVIIYHGIRKEK